jgi:hypothetical protein
MLYTRTFTTHFKFQVCYTTFNFLQLSSPQEHHDNARNKVICHSYTSITTIFLSHLILYNHKVYNTYVELSKNQSINPTRKNLVFPFLIIITYCSINHNGHRQLHDKLHNTINEMDSSGSKNCLWSMSAHISQMSP